MSCLLKVDRLVYIMQKEAVKELEICGKSFIVKVIFINERVVSFL